MAKLDELELLLRETRVASRREEKQKIAEAEAAERVAKLLRMRNLREAFDAERFRWFITHQDRIVNPKRMLWTIEQWRTAIDFEMGKEEKKRA